MSEQENKWQRIYDLLHAENKVSLNTVYKVMKNSKPKKSFYGIAGAEDWT